MRLDRDVLRSLDRLTFLARRPLPGGGRGDRRGQRRGRGLEFADYRAYAQGDDFRHIDWKAYKRLNRLLVRLFAEEQDLHVHLFIDASLSMAVNGKFTYAAHLAAALGYVAVSRLDRMTVWPFGDELRRELAGGGARRSLGRLFESLEAVAPSGRTDLRRVFTDFSRRQSRRGVAVVLSDFLDEAGVGPALRLLSGLGHDVTALHLVAPADRVAPEVTDDLRVVDAETGAERVVSVTPGLLRAYGEAWTALDRQVVEACSKAGAQYIKVDVEVPFQRTVRHTLRAGRLLE